MVWNLFLISSQGDRRQWRESDAGGLFFAGSGWKAWDRAQTIQPSLGKYPWAGRPHPFSLEPSLSKRAPRQARRAGVFERGAGAETLTLQAYRAVRWQSGGSSTSCLRPQASLSGAPRRWPSCGHWPGSPPSASSEHDVLQLVLAVSPRSTEPVSGVPAPASLSAASCSVLSAHPGRGATGPLELMSQMPTGYGRQPKGPSRGGRGTRGR